MASWKGAGAAALGAVILAGTGWLVLHRPVPATPAAPTPALGRATVVRTSVTARDIVTGTLGYLDPVTVVAGASGGVLTWLPDPGTTIRPDQRLYEVDGRPVVLWTGTRPAWRDLVPGMAPGPDLTQAERNLAGSGGHLTGAAIRRWQAAHGLPRTGVIGLGQVVFQPGPVRIGTVPAALGTPLHPGLTILTATSTSKAVSVRLDPYHQGAVHPGDRVTVTLPGGRTTSGTVASVGAPVSTVDGQNTGTTVPITIRLDTPADADGLDVGSVQVAIVTDRHDNVLAVPIDALLAAPDGGYQVAVTTGGQRHLVTVHCGLFDETGGLVEVTGDLSAGTTVEVPAS
jgi:hypothetical protein